MFLKLTCIFLILNTCVLVCDCATSMANFNDTFVYDFIIAQFAKFRSEQAAIRLEQALFRSEQEFIKSEQVLTKSELERQEKLLDAILDKSVYGRSCAEVASKYNQSGLYKILIPSYSNKPFRVYCDMETQGGNWTIILQRMDGSVNFTRNWEDYKKGFGDLLGEFFLGLDKIHALTADESQELLVLLEDYQENNHKAFETYEEFAIGNERESYALKTLGKANGTAGDSLSYHHGQKFSTFDKDNDAYYRVNCAKQYSGAWWYNSCHESHLTGIYKDDTLNKGINWATFRGYDYSLKRAIMMIRPRRTEN